MAQSLSSILIHTVFSTKLRRPLILPTIMKDLHSYMSNIARFYESDTYEIGGTENHVHLLISLPRTITICKLIEEIKKGSSKWIKTKDSFCKDFAWQGGYGAFSIGQSNLSALKNYIQNQAEHHKKVTFEEEYILFLKKYNVTYNEKYVWD